MANLTMTHARALLASAAAIFELEAATARQWAQVRDYAANIGLAQEFDRHAYVIREALAMPDEPSR